MARKSSAPRKNSAARTRPTTVAEYIRAAPREAQPHLRRLRAILRKAAPDAEETLKWGNPFFVEPRFLFAYSAQTAHVNLAPIPQALAAFRKDLERYRTTKHMLQLPYAEPLPEDLIRRIAEYYVQHVSERKSDSFW